MLTRRALLHSVPAAAYAAAAKLPTAEGPQFIVAALTMCDKNGRLNDSLNRDYLRFLEKGGADGVLVMGTTGEFSSFSVAERKQALESTLKHAGKLSVMCQISTSNLPETLDLLEHAQRAGAGSVLALPPFYFKNVTLEGLLAWYVPILKTARVPVLLYNIPQLSGVAITPALLHRLESMDRLYDMKDSFSKTDAMIAFLKEFPKLRILTGVPGNIEANLANSGAGGLTGNGSVLVKETAAIFQAHRTRGDVAAAQRAFNERAKALGGYDGVPAGKYLLSRMGLGYSGVRTPFVPLTPEQERKLDAAFGL